MMLNTQAWPKYGYIEPQPGSLVPVTVARKGNGISSGQFVGTALFRGRKVAVSAPVKGYSKIWNLCCFAVNNTLANEAGGWN